VVIGGQILIRDGPVVAHAICRAGLEIDFSKPQSDPSPVIGSSPYNARAKPAKRRTWGRSIRLTLDGPGSVRSHEFSSTEIFVTCPANPSAAVSQFVRPGQHLEVLGRIHRWTCLQHHHVESALG